ncbi:unnamed protein product [Amoebophrya sp. A25]|nr:unnamed protein product [Amoebophrya sp. A25]|eukprot:GSA25T00002562001.1
MRRGFVTSPALPAARPECKKGSTLASGEARAHSLRIPLPQQELAAWIGSGRRKKAFLNFEEARAYVREQGIKSASEWIHYSSTARPPWIPSTPSGYYKGRGFVGFADFCGYAPRLRKRVATLHCPEALALSRKQARYRITHAISLQGIDLFVKTMKKVAPEMRFTMAPRMSRTTMLYTVDSDGRGQQTEQWATLLVFSTQTSSANLHRENVPETGSAPNSTQPSKLAPQDSFHKFLMRKRGAHGAGIVGVNVPQSLFFVRDFSERYRRAVTSREEAATMIQSVQLALEKPESQCTSPTQIGRGKSRKPQRTSITFRESQAVRSPLDLALQLKTWFEHAEKRAAPDWWRDLASTGGAHRLSQMCLRVVMKHVYGPLQMNVEVPRRDAWTYNTIVGDGVKVLHRMGKPTPVAGGSGCDVYVGKRNTQATGIIPFSTEDPIDVLVVYMLRRQQGQPCDVKDDVPLNESGIRGIFVFPRSVLIQHFVDPAVGNEGSTRLGVYHPDAVPRRTSRYSLRKKEFEQYFIDFEKFPNYYDVDAIMPDEDQKKAEACHAELEKVREIFANVVRDIKTTGDDPHSTCA